MLRRMFISGLAAVGTLSAGGAGIAQDTVKIGLILPMTGQQTTTGKQIEVQMVRDANAKGPMPAGVRSRPTSEEQKMHPKAVQFRRIAETCRLQADRATSAFDKDYWLEVAKQDEDGCDGRSSKPWAD